MTKLLNAVRNYRNELFGLSILTIMIFHYFEDVNNAKIGGALTAVAKGYTLLIGSAGVEVFLFLSGMGLFFSLSRSPKILPFYKKRLVRVLPAYIILGGAGWAVLDLIIKYKGLRAFASDFSTLSFWLKGERLVWYISLILILYLLFPLLFKILSIKKKPLAAAVLCSVVAVLLAGTVALKYAAPDFYKHTEIALWRVFPFILGALYQRDVGSDSAFGKGGDNKKPSATAGQNVSAVGGKPVIRDVGSDSAFGKGGDNKKPSATAGQNFFAVGGKPVIRDVGPNSAAPKRGSLGVVFAVLCGLGILLKAGGVLVGSGAGFPMSLLRLRLNNLLYPIVLMLAATGLLMLVNSERLNRLLRRLGSISLELYLSHVIIRRISKELGFQNHNILVYLAYIALSFAVAVALHFLLGKILRKKN